jgi:hypothetical protein
MVIFRFFFVFNVAFSNISAISWRPALVVEEAGHLYHDGSPIVGGI